MSHPSSAQAQYGTFGSSSTSTSISPHIGNPEQQGTLPFTGAPLALVLVAAVIITAAGAALLAFLKERS